jgi:hypothetical protein
MKFCIVVVCTLRKVYNQVTKWPSDQWPSDQWPTNQLYPVVILIKFFKVVVCTSKKVYHQVTKWPVIRWLSDQVTSDQVTSEKDDEQYHRSNNLKWKIL